MSIKLKKKIMQRGAPMPKMKFPEAVSIKSLPSPESVSLRVPEAAGISSEVLVKKGDSVLTGQKIAGSAADKTISVHASISGEVTGVISFTDAADGETIKIVTISSNGKDEQVELQSVEDLNDINTEEMLEKIGEAGIVSAGKVSISLYDKLKNLRNKKIDNVILNGCASDLYVSASYSILMEYGQKVLSGLEIIKRILSPSAVYITIEDYQEAAAAHLEKLIEQSGLDFKIVPVKVRYPPYEERIIVKTVLDKDVPVNGTPADEGAAVFDAGSAKAVSEAVMEGRPFIDRVVSVIGSVKNPGDVIARFGTSIEKLIEYCGGYTKKNIQVVINGTVNGTAVYDISTPLEKNCDCILVNENKPLKISGCINCGRCVEVCPMGLMPNYYPRLVEAGRYEECREYYIESCIECGACAYVCPSNIPIVEYVKIAKKKL
jgi:Na+-translocating ferredoxin:NAD+ oxidoreductase subunit C